MTVASETNLITAIANGSQTVFPYTFRALASADLVVIGELPSGSETYYTEGTHYTVSGVGSYAGGNVTFGTAPSNGTRITIRRAISAITQTTDLRNQGAFFAETHEDVFDRLTMMVQTLKTDSSRSMRARVSDFAAGVSTELPNASGAQLLGWNAGGTALTNYSAAELNASTFSTESRTATASQTVFTLTSLVYTPGTNNLAVYRNGLRLAPSDYTETNSTTVTLATGATAGDKFLFVGARVLNDAIGGESVQFVQEGTGAVPRSQQSKSRDFKSFKDFGAVGDGVTDDTAAVLAALQSGFPVDGGGLTYAVSGTVQPSSFKGLRNCTLKQTNQSGVLACVTLYIKYISGFFIENISIDRGTNPYPNAAYDSNPNGALNFVFGLKIEGTGATYSNDFWLKDVEVFGDGSGNGIGLWWCRDFDISGSYVHDMRARLTGTITDDVVQGIWFSNCEDYTGSGNRVARLYAWNGTAYTNIYSRGIAGGNARGFSLSNSVVTLVDQCYDFTGTGDGVDGNRNFSLTGCVADRGAAVGFKFANACHDIIVTGCTAINCGDIGFLVSGMKTAGTSIPEKVDFVGCQSVNTGFVTGRPSMTYRAGFYISREPEVDGFQPRSIRFKSCFVKDNQATKTTQTGFLNTVFPIEYPSTGYDKDYANTVTDCHVQDGITTPYNGISPNICQSRRDTAQSISNATWTAIAWNADAFDSTGIHNASTNDDSFYIKSTGWYRIEASVQFDANATGGRLAKIEINGSDYDPSIMNTAPISGQSINAFTCATRYLTSGNRIRVLVYQNSGAALSTVAGWSVCTVQKVEA
jgi:hypothetical protein